jgi:hypothetical protein
LNIPSPKPLSLDNQDIDDEILLKNLEITIYNQKPTLRGLTENGTQVYATWRSLIYGSSIIADNPTGEFTITAPNELELGEHKVMLYAIRPDGKRSPDIMLSFVVKEQEKSFLGDNAWLNWWWLLALLIILGLIGLGYYFWRRNSNIEALVSHILIAYLGSAHGETAERSKEDAYVLAAELYDQLLEGQDFSTLAEKFSDDLSKESGGNLGYIKRGLMPRAFDRAVFTAKKGDLKGPVETQYGFHIIKVWDFRAPEKSLYEDTESIQEAEEDKKRSFFNEAASEAPKPQTATDSDHLSIKRDQNETGGKAKISLDE